MVTYLGSGDRGFAGHLRGRYKQHARANGKVKQVGRHGGRQRQISWDSFWFSVFYIRTRFLSLFGSAITDNIFSMNGHILLSSTRFPGIVKRQLFLTREFTIIARPSLRGSQSDGTGRGGGVVLCRWPAAAQPRFPTQADRTGAASHEPQTQSLFSQ